MASHTGYCSEKIALAHTSRTDRVLRQNGVWLCVNYVTFALLDRPD
jgi:hypothetical protein